MKYLLTFGILISAFGIASAQNPWGAFVKKKGDTMKGDLDFADTHNITNLLKVTFSDGSSLTNAAAADLSPYARKDASNNFTTANTFTTNYVDKVVFSSDGSSLTNAAGVDLSPYFRLAGTNTISADNNFTAPQRMAGIYPEVGGVYDIGKTNKRYGVVYATNFNGSGSMLTVLSAASLTGTISTNNLPPAALVQATTSASDLTSGTIDPLRLPVSWTPQETNSVTGTWTLDLSTNVYHRANMTGNVTNWTLTVADTNALTVGRVDLYGANTNTLTVPTGWIVNGAAGSTYTNSFMSIVIETGMGATAVGKTRYSND